MTEAATTKARSVRAGLKRFDIESSGKRGGDVEEVAFALMASFSPALCCENLMKPPELLVLHHSQGISRDHVTTTPECGLAFWPATVLEPDAVDFSRATIRGGEHEFFKPDENTASNAHDCAVESGGSFRQLTARADSWCAYRLLPLRTGQQGARQKQ